MYWSASGTSIPCDSLVSSMSMLSRHSYSACRLLRFATLHRPHSRSWGTIRRLKTFRSESAADDGEYERKGTTVKRKVAMHVAYRGTGYQGIQHTLYAS